NFSDIKLFFKYISNIYKNYEIYNFITITAESCDNFTDRKHGMTNILEYCSNHIVGNKLYYTNTNKFIDYNSAINKTEELFSTNWMLTSKFLNSKKNIDLIIDIGSTTTDIIFKDMHIGSNINDYMRLVNKTLLYQGVVRTPLSMMTDNVLFKGNNTSLVNEVFATTGDIFNLHGDIDFSKLDYLGSDNLQFTKVNSFTRLARIIGLDYKESEREYLIVLSKYFKELFISKIIENIKIIFSNKIDDITISAIGEGRFLIEEISDKCGVKYLLIDEINDVTIKNIDKDKVYTNMTSALVVMNFINK
ncbi:hypothetical protein OAN90_02565, partial [Gammaproteobacteria bacterium]|nr:hypothetical protein [Gammaproteobacteria bacterium]